MNVKKIIKWKKSRGLFHLKLGGDVRTAQSYTSLKVFLSVMFVVAGFT